MSNFKVSQLPASVELAVEDILPVVDVSQMLTRKAEVGDLIDLASTTIESMPNLIVDPENNFTNFSQAVRTQITAGDGITYTSTTGEVKLTNKSITINGNTVNLGGSTTIPVGTTYTAGTGINISPTNVISATPVAAGVTSIASVAEFNNLTFSSPNGNVSANFSSEPNFYTIAAAATSTNGGLSIPPKRAIIANFITNLDKIALKVESSQTLSASIPAVSIANTGIGNSLIIDQTNTGNTNTALLINNFGTGNCFEVRDNPPFFDPEAGNLPDFTRFVINSDGNVAIGKATPECKLDIQSSGLALKVLQTSADTNSVEVLNGNSSFTGKKFIIDGLGNVGINVSSVPTTTPLIVGSTNSDLVFVEPGTLMVRNFNSASLIEPDRIFTKKLILNGSVRNLGISQLSGSAGFSVSLDLEDNFVVGLSAGTVILPTINQFFEGIEYTIKKIRDRNIIVQTSNGQLIYDSGLTSLNLNSSGKNQTITLKAVNDGSGTATANYGWWITHETSLDVPPFGGGGFIPYFHAAGPLP